MTLMESDEIYVRQGAYSGGFYYKTIEMHVPRNDYYTISSNSSLDAYGYLYEFGFDKSSPWRNMVHSNDDSGGNFQFLFKDYLYSDTTYIVVVTTFKPGVIGPISLIGRGPTTISLELVYNLTSPTTTFPTTTDCE